METSGTKEQCQLVLAFFFSPVSMNWVRWVEQKPHDHLTSVLFQRNPILAVLHRDFVGWRQRTFIFHWIRTALEFGWTCLNMEKHHRYDTFDWSMMRSGSGRENNGGSTFCFLFCFFLFLTSGKEQIKVVSDQEDGNWISLPISKMFLLDFVWIICQLQTALETGWANRKGPPTTPFDADAWPVIGRWRSDQHPAVDGTQSRTGVLFYRRKKPKSQSTSTADTSSGSAPVKKKPVKPGKRQRNANKNQHGMGLFLFEWKKNMVIIILNLI